MLSYQDMTFKTLSSRLIYTGRVFKLRSDRVQFPDGSTTSLDVLEHGGAVVILPVAADGRLVMIRQYRHPTGKTLLEFPAGTLEPGEDPEACALRELREETGFAASRLERLGGIYLAPGYSTEYLHIYLASGLSRAPLPKDQDEWLEVETLSHAELLEQVRNGDLEDAKSLAGLYLAGERLSGAG